MASRRCKKCGAEKPLEDFHRQTGTKDGLRSQCKACQKVTRGPRKVRPATYSRPTERRCPRCRASKPAAAFYNNAARADGLSIYCRLCTTQMRPTIEPEQSRAWRYRREFGITIADYDRMFAQQGGRCAICRRADAAGKNGRFHVDHDHKTGQVRALLCERCNRGLGHYDDDPERLEAAARYLRGFKRD
jgi:hypothetical protein